MTNEQCALYTFEANKIANIVISKREAYGEYSLEQVDAIIAILYPTGISTKDYPKALTIIRLLDKVTRLVTAKVDDKEDAWVDIAGYALRSIVRNKESKSENLCKVCGKNLAVRDGECIDCSH